MPKKSILPTALALAAIAYATTRAPGLDSPTTAVAIWVLAACFSLWAIVKWAPSLVPSISAHTTWPRPARRRAQAATTDRIWMDDVSWEVMAAAGSAEDPVSNTVRENLQNYLGKWKYFSAEIGDIDQEQHICRVHAYPT